MKQNAIEVTGLNKKFGNRHIIENFNLEIEKGEFVAIVGPSGCGKSTLLNVLGMLEKYDGGKIKINGKKLPEINSKAATMVRRNVINYLFQNYALIDNETVEKNLLIAMEFVNKSHKEKINMISKTLDYVGLKHLQKEVVNTLSGGEQQRVALARTILKPGNIVLADEPTGSLDPKSSDNAFGLIKQLCKENGKTVVMVTHNMELAKRADRIVEMPLIRK
ncbi:putative bacteriocin export ABC transporter [Lachnobacterium bovis]|uniref:Putative ABC transport system ATP-binding protein n=1 Tax=Lachnobacterium bovis DSM 14045 TaxID=1122142 RepID=A0A1H3G924_9FIRM|nr:putative bacteriocin export ABC transporter [Lachnobacterium bovis]SDX99547.1 putative ABC transport system ATP-binding protein [Lachnobacterium bovis DSM 14045]